jgi:hypothetical protein
VAFDERSPVERLGAGLDLLTRWWRRLRPIPGDRGSDRSPARGEGRIFGRWCRPVCGGRHLKASVKTKLFAHVERVYAG